MGTRANIAVVSVLQQTGLALAFGCMQTTIAWAYVDTQHVCFADPCLDAGSPNNTPGMQPSMHMSANRNAACFFYSVLPLDIVVNELPGPKSGGGLRSTEVRVIRIGAVRVGASHTPQHAIHLMAKRSASEVISRGFGQGNRTSAHHQSEIASPPHDNPGHAEYYQPQPSNTQANHLGRRVQVLGLILLFMRARVGNLRFLVLLAVICVHSESLAVSAAPVPGAVNIDSGGNQKHADMWPNALVSYPTKRNAVRKRTLHRQYRRQAMMHVQAVPTRQQKVPQPSKGPRLSVYNYNAGGLDYHSFMAWTERPAVKHDITIVTETRRSFEAEWLTKSYVCVHSDGPYAGLLVMIRRTLAEAHQVSWGIQVPGRLVHVKLHLAMPVHIVAAYQHAWKSDKKAETLRKRAKWLQMLSKTLRASPIGDITVCAGDFNADLPHWPGYVQCAVGQGQRGSGALRADSDDLLQIKWGSNGHAN